jgi:hypothetical protein
MLAQHALAKRQCLLLPCCMQAVLLRYTCTTTSRSRCWLPWYSAVEDGQRATLLQTHVKLMPVLLALHLSRRMCRSRAQLTAAARSPDPHLL